MSKGLGSAYVQRMKRYHVPFDKSLSPGQRLEIICDRAFYHVGAFKYKLPRYYRDKLYRKKFPCDARVWNKKKMCYENKIVYRYKSKNPLAIQMQNEVRNRINADYVRRIGELRQANPSATDSEIHILYSKIEASARMDRRKTIYSKMSRFYNSNRFKNRKF